MVFNTMRRNIDNRRSVNSKRLSLFSHIGITFELYWAEDFIDELMHELLSQSRHVRGEHRLSRNWLIFSLNKRKARVIHPRAINLLRRSLSMQSLFDDLQSAARQLICFVIQYWQKTRDEIREASMT